MRGAGGGTWKKGDFVQVEPTYMPEVEGICKIDHIKCSKEHIQWGHYNKY